MHLGFPPSVTLPNIFWLCRHCPSRVLVAEYLYIVKPALPTWTTQYGSHCSQGRHLDLICHVCMDITQDKLEAAKHDIKSAEDNGASDTAALKILKEREYELRAALGELQPSAGMSAEAQIKDFKEQKIPDLEEHVAREKAHAKKLQGSQSEISQLKERAHRVNEDMAEMRYKLEDAEHELAEEELTLGRLQTEALRLVVAVCREGTGYVGPDAWSSIGPLNGAWPSEQAA